MKKVLIISPHFPPVNSADMQRVRQSLPYFRQLGWEPTVIAVDEKYVDAYSTDALLLETFPKDIRVIKVRALPTAYTRRFGIGSLSLRSYFSIKKQGNQLLRKEKFDLIYFSTTAFHVMALGPGWKRKFGVPYILDIQDPWYNTYYFENALKNKTLKAKMFHALDRLLETKTLPFADGIISVSAGYRELYTKRYPMLPAKKFAIIPFGCAVMDFAIAQKKAQPSYIKFSAGEINVVYIGRGGEDMEFAGRIIFDGLKMGLLQKPEVFKKLRLWFIGTSYATAGRGSKTFEPLAVEKGAGDSVTEIPDRQPYFETLRLLAHANALLVPGSSDPTYTASKIYPYIYLNKPLLTLFHKNSSVCDVMQETNTGTLLSFDERTTTEEINSLTKDVFEFLLAVAENKINDGGLKPEAFEKYTAAAMTARQTIFFDEVLKNKAARPVPVV